MPSRIGSAAIALGLAIGLIVPLAHDASIAQEEVSDPSDTAQTGTEQRERDDKGEQFSVPVTIVEGPPESEAARRSEAEREERERNDLIAQNRAAEAGARSAELAWWQSLWSAIQTGLVFIGTIALIWTLYETRRTANSAVASNRMLRVEQRPWLTVEPAIKGDLRMHKDVAIVDLCITVRNIGRAPAEKVTVHCELIATANIHMSGIIQHYTALAILTQNRHILGHHGLVIFPNDSLTTDHHVSALAPEKGRLFEGERTAIPLSIIISVLYHFEVQEREPITAVSYRFIRKDQPNRPHAGFFFLDEEKVPGDVLRLEPSFGSLIQ